jgi:WD40 repeat protein
MMKRELTGHSNRVRCVVFAPDGARLASGSDDKTIRVWNVSTGKSERKFSGHSAWVRSVAFSPDGSRIASGSDDGTLRIWNISTGENQLKLTALSDWMRSVAFSFDGLYVSSTSQDTTRMWNLQTGDLKEEIRHDMMGKRLSPLISRTELTYCRSFRPATINQYLLELPTGSFEYRQGRRATYTRLPIWRNG